MSCFLMRLIGGSTLLLFAGAALPAGFALSCIDYSLNAHWIAGIDLPGSAEKIAVVGDYAYVACGDGGLRVLDVSDPAAPAEVGSVDLNGPAVDLAVEGGRAYAIIDGEGMRVVDISDPLDPKRKGFVALPCNYLCGIDVEGDYAFVPCRTGQLWIIDISNPNNPSEVGSFPDLTYPCGIAVAGNLAVATRNWGFGLYDMTDPEHPVLVGEYSQAPVEDESLEFTRPVIVGDTLFSISNWTWRDWDGSVITESGSVKAWDISDPTAPAQILFRDLSSHHLDDLDVAGSLVYAVSADEGFFVVDTEAEVEEQISGIRLSGGCLGVAASDGLALVATAGYGVQTVAHGTGFIGDCDGYGGYPSVDLEADGNLAYVLRHWYEPWELIDWFILEIYELQGSEDHVRLSQVSEDWIDAYGLARCGHYVIVLDQGTYYLIDVTDPAAPSEFQPVYHPYVMDDMRVVDDHGFAIAGSPRRFAVFDLTDPYAPVEIAALPAVVPQAIAIKDHHAYAVSLDSLYVVDVSEPAAPVVVAIVPGGGRSVAVSGDWAYVGDYSSALDPPYSLLRSVDISDPLQPTLLGETEMPGLPVDLTVAGGIGYAACDLPGLVVVDLGDPGFPSILGGLGGDSAIGVHRWQDGLFLLGYRYTCSLPLDCATSGPVSVAPLRQEEAGLRISIQPNPCNPGTSISFSLERPQWVSLTVYDLSGRLVARLYEGQLPAGERTGGWDGRDRFGRSVASGTYLLQLRTDRARHVQKLMLVR